MKIAGRISGQNGPERRQQPSTSRVRVRMHAGVSRKNLPEQSERGPEAGMVQVCKERQESEGGDGGQSM